MSSPDTEKVHRRPETRSARHRRYLQYLAVCALFLLVHHFAVQQPDTARLRRDLPHLAHTLDNEVLSDIIHLNNLNEACFHAGDVVIPWTYNSTEVDLDFVWSRDDTPRSQLIQFLAQCPEVDVFLPPGLRNHGYCEDGMAYVKFLKTRALPIWVFDLRFDYQDRKSISYFDLCPHTAMIFMNHYLEGIPDRPNFPKEKKIILMPNVEMFELKTKEYQRFDAVLCKTRDAYDRLTQWFAEVGNPRNTTVFDVQHTSSDPSTVARTHHSKHPALPRIKPRSFEKMTFFHASGHSAQKNTKGIFQCWQSRPDLPPIDIYSMYSGVKEDYDAMFGTDGAPTNIRFHFGEDIDVAHFGRLLLETSAILCPSKMEGFGHYINQARASGALVLTTNGAPMNEFVDETSGVLIEASRLDPNPNQLLSIYGGMEWDVTSDAICDAVDQVMALTPAERRERGENGRRRYEDQLRDFKRAMRHVRAEFDNRP
ncbi:hypothetical protein SDRG_15988 [Saprolegnia diclina VS20]|uniref:Glycosyl transferase family 1 domain-containing protein n=1 Tax=Saprolegnia diclina (strain VS20) TaxID=1156394 RepID=T0PLB9_SAPDV|nr:hypothetical protein SDRG_15988 [Saprolegnia diclina VS20]EQC26184.1 hypothetical protein SDRG_15988 [Saprolegnia diclina VS20]|eukprot:XP_008620399.1 hypothetical protein SDRG_15988 [Saprolegnia diclina VS20]